MFKSILNTSNCIIVSITKDLIDRLLYNDCSHQF